MSKHLGEIVFGAIGAGFGLTGSLFALLEHLTSYKGLSFEPRLAILFSIIGFIGAGVLHFKRVLGAVLLIVAGIGGVFCLYQMYALAAALLIGAGGMALFSGSTDRVNLSR